MIEPRLIESRELAMIAYDVDRSRDRDFIMISGLSCNEIAILDRGMIQVRIYYGGGMIESEHDIRCGPSGLNMVSASRALDFIVEFYPEYATWFLFHPELF
jgi:hypothetical protein